VHGPVTGRNLSTSSLHPPLPPFGKGGGGDLPEVHWKEEGKGGEGQQTSFPKQQVGGTKFPMKDPRKNQKKPFLQLGKHGS